MKTAYDAAKLRGSAGFGRTISFQVVNVVA
jgi:hypothetical protein